MLDYLLQTSTPWRELGAYTAIVAAGFVAFRLVSTWRRMLGPGRIFGLGLLAWLFIAVAAQARLLQVGAPPNEVGVVIVAVNVCIILVMILHPAMRTRHTRATERSP